MKIIVPADPDFTKMSAGELETFIGELDAPVLEIRQQQLRAHAVLERKQQQERNREIAERPASFPKSQIIGSN